MQLYIQSWSTWHFKLSSEVTCQYGRSAHRALDAEPNIQASTRPSFPGLTMPNPWHENTFLCCLKHTDIANWCTPKNACFSYVHIAYLCESIQNKHTACLFFICTGISCECRAARCNVLILGCLLYFQPQKSVMFYWLVCVKEGRV